MRDDEDKEYIASAAVRIGSRVYVGARHWLAAQVALNSGEVPPIALQPEDQGFMTTKGRYVSRYEAARIAFAAQQTSALLTTLYSEDLWGAPRTAASL